MINLLFKIINRLNNLNYVSAIKIFYYVLLRNFSKYPRYLKKFENKISKEFNSKYALTFSSGTGAFYASVLSLGLKDGSKILVSRMTFPSVLNILKILKYKIYFFDVDKQFQPILKNIDSDINYDLIIVTHPFGFFCNFEKLKIFKNDKTKLIFDCSHSQGLTYKDKNINEYADIAFFSLQGQKAITGGEGGVILTDEKQFYHKMINMHHPGHNDNFFSSDYTGVSLNIKLRMHPLASLIADESLNKFEKNNQKIFKKYLKIYKFLESYKSIDIPLSEYPISGFHYGLPFYFNSKVNKFNWPIIKYNWPIYMNDSLELKKEENKNDIYNNLYFIDLNFIKSNSINVILSKLKVILKNDL